MVSQYNEMIRNEEFVAQFTFIHLHLTVPRKQLNI